MIRTLILSFMLTTVAAAPLAQAQPAAKEEKAGAGQFIYVQNLVTPVVRDGRLVNYLFINCRIQMAPGVDVWRAREKGHFLRDALIRAVHRRSLASPDRVDQLDQAAAQALITSVARQVLGAQSVASVQIVGVSSLRQGSGARS